MQIGQVAKIGNIMALIEGILLKEKPSLVITYGDVDSTLAASLTAARLRFPVAHMEAGLRSNDWTMPEEVNRIVADRVSDYLFATSEDAVENLYKECTPRAKVYFVGNLMIDSLIAHRALAAKKSRILKALGLASRSYAVLTLHRPTNVDNAKKLRDILVGIRDVQKLLPVVFVVHPRTRKRLSEFRLDHIVNSMPNLIKTSPLGYLDFLRLAGQSRMVLTDSGGIQEETTAFGIPCLTLRENTERPITVTQGTNRLVGTGPAAIIRSVRRALHSKRPTTLRLPRFWDGHAARRIVSHLKRILL